MGFGDVKRSISNGDEEQCTTSQRVMLHKLGLGLGGEEKPKDGQN